MTLPASQIHWNNQTYNYDLEKYNWPAWALSVVQEVAPQVNEAAQKPAAAPTTEKKAAPVAKPAA